MNKDKEVKEIAEQMFQQGYVEGKRADIVAGVYNILTNERNIAGNPALAIRICDYVADEVRGETAKEILQVLFDNHFEKVNDYENRRVGYAVQDFYCEIKRLAKKYGVEVDE